ncbi:MAG: aminotransferase class I/II-fold pyridoxal phosphate-dependent enzyme [Gemmatimonadaceae bacterium]|nr:aminotransferase class I/II-fold pyridoxal phosphate-dependent enzyme [Gemmatimonadaceae bacterium]
MSSRLLSAIPQYVFWELDARRRAARAEGRTLIDLGIGSPDQPIAPVVMEAIQRAAAEPALSGYPHFTMHPAYGEAIAAYLITRFAVSVDPTRELLALAGSKEGLAELVLSHVNPGDVVLIPAVYYPVYSRAPQLAGATPVCVPMDGDGRLDLGAIASDDLARARMLIVNYPSNPTTATITLSEFERLVDFARRHDLLLVSDLAYSELAFDGHVVPSVLQVPGARDVAVELHTCSKSFNMAGVRIAFVAGNAKAIAVLDQYRANIGYGVSTLAQRAGAAAFTHAATIVPPVVAEYRARRDALVSAFQANGWPVKTPSATMYLWLRVPDGFDDWGWVDALIRGPGVVVTPGIAFGDAGRGHFRISLVQPPAVLTQAAALMASVTWPAAVP